eukprot:CAMPEP_0119195194 /NCGR_PEP_ID=MMETSP1316-20130426/5103_1 /TAXON_ID=41880 /ORGANISM="Pycnococcus provasolii, Strain RCC2336" /LENGTH=39 /DNA_ID= /DNA_START= /DNA_END= /DNA_ORIENTATION=
MCGERAAPFRPSAYAPTELVLKYYVVDGDEDEFDEEADE